MFIALIRLRGKEDFQGSWSESCEPIGLGYIASTLRHAGHEVRILDELTGGMSREEIISAIAERPPSIVGISVSSQGMWPDCEETARDIKSQAPYIHVTIGGHLPSARPVEILKRYPAIDSVVVGEGEMAIVELADAIASSISCDHILGLCYRKNGFITCNPPRPTNDNLDIIPPIARDLIYSVLKKAPVANLITSRGCHGACDFCSMNAFYGRQGCSQPRYRSVQSVCKEE
jgi:radical SAM superfamily enzyme YgiQ (UPF0313 family)